MPGTKQQALCAGGNFPKEGGPERGEKEKIVGRERRVVGTDTVSFVKSQPVRRGRISEEGRLAAGLRIGRGEGER